MCVGHLYNGSDDVTDVLEEMRKLASILDVVFIVHGVLLPAVILAGLLLNLTCLLVLCKTSLRSAPYYLLRTLTICDICILLFAVYSDVEPAIRSKVELSGVKQLLVADCQKIESLQVSSWIAGGSNTSSEEPTTGFNVSQTATGTKEVTFEGLSRTEMNEKLLMLLLMDVARGRESAGELMNRTAVKRRSRVDPYIDKMTSHTYSVTSHPKDMTSSTGSVTSPAVTSSNGNVTSSYTDPILGVAINTRPVAQAAERCFSYSLMTLNLGITLTLATERWLAVTFPFR